jgi:hypothetical protein
MANLGWPRIRAMNEPLAIDADTIACEWDDNPVDYGAIVGHLVVAGGLGRLRHDQTVAGLLATSFNSVRSHPVPVGRSDRACAATVAKVRPGGRVIRSKYARLVSLLSASNAERQAKSH